MKPVALLFRDQNGLSITVYSSFEGLRDRVAEVLLGDLAAGFLEADEALDRVEYARNMDDQSGLRLIDDAVFAYEEARQGRTNGERMWIVSDLKIDPLPVS